MSDLLIYGILLHLIVDWLFQNEWIAINKVNLRSAAGWIHAGIHTLAMLLIFPTGVSFAIGVAHLIIDTRKPLQWWANVIKTPKQGEIAMHIAIWRDQVLHFAVIGLAAFWMFHH